MVDHQPGWGRVWAVGCLVAGAFAALQLALSNTALVEPDSVRMSYGIAHAIRSGEELGARDLYGRAVSFGYYLLFLRVIPQFDIPLSALPALMNALNMICVSAAFIPLVGWMSRLWGLGVASLSACLLATAPVIFELGGAGHPSGPAFFLLNVALAVYLVPGREAQPRWWGITMAAVLMLAAATLRATVLLAAPLFPLLGLARARVVGDSGRSAQPIRIVVAGLAVGVFATVIFLAMQHRVMAMAPPRLFATNDLSSGQVGPWTLLGEHLRTAGNRAAIFKGFAVTALGIGPLLFALGWIGVAVAFIRRDWNFALAATSVVLVNLAMWAPHPTPSRHFHQTYLMLAPAAVLSLRSLVKPRHRTWAAAVLMALNLLSMVATYPVVVSRYPFKFVKVLSRRTSTRVPMGDPFTNRVWVRRRVAIEEAEARGLAMAAEPRLLVFGSPVVLRLIFLVTSESPSYRLDYEQHHGAILVAATTPKTRYLIYEFADGNDVPPAELMQRIAVAGDLKDHAVAIVPADRLIGGEIIVPDDYRRFELLPLSDHPETREESWLGPPAMPEGPALSRSPAAAAPTT